MEQPKGPIGVVLAGGEGTRMGGSKLTVQLRGEPLLRYPLAALQAALGEVAVIAKPDAQLPSLPGVTVWLEPQLPRHPLVGIVHALELCENRSVFVCAADLPFVTASVIEQIARTPADGAPAVIATCQGSVQPLLGVYHPIAALLLADAAHAADRPVRQVVAEIGPRLVEVEDPDCLFNVNSPNDLLLARAMLDRRGPRSKPNPPAGYPNVKS